MKKLRALALLALAPLLPACALGIECDASMAHSVNIRVVDEAGRNVPDAQVRYSLNGGPERQAACVEFPLGDSVCSGWAAGQEETGDFVIKATSADGARQAEGRVSVEEGRCHVDSKQLQLTLR